MATSGRQSALDAVKRGQICAILAVGGSRATAARYVKCAVSTIRRTAERDAAFAAEIERAEANLEVIHLSNIQRISKRAWHASAWVLERVYPERYGRRAPDTVPVEQLQDLLHRFNEMLLEEIADEPFRERILARLNELIAKARPAAPKKGARRAKPK